MLKKFWDWLKGLFSKPKPPPEPEPVPEPEPTCGCSSEKIVYQGEKETIINGLDGRNDVRCLIDWKRPDGPCSWLTDSQVRPHVHFSGNRMTVECFNLDDTRRAHYVGFVQPKAKSNLISGSPVTVGSGTLRLVWESRKKL